MDVPFLTRLTLDIPWGNLLEARLIEYLEHEKIQSSVVHPTITTCSSFDQRGKTPGVMLGDQFVRYLTPPGGTDSGRSSRDDGSANTQSVVRVLQLRRLVLKLCIREDLTDGILFGMLRSRMAVGLEGATIILNGSLAMFQATHAMDAVILAKLKEANQTRLIVQ